MKSQPPLNLLLAYRKRSALSQEEVAFLLGVQSGSKVCRYERLLRQPELQTALAYEAIFGRPVSELFPSLHAKTRRAVQDRARTLGKRRFNGSPKFVERKRSAISAITTTPKN